MTRDRRTLRRHRRRDRQRGHPLRRPACDGADAPGRAHARGQPHGRLAHEPRGARADHGAARLPAEHRLAQRRSATRRSWAPYTASKAGVEALTDCLRVELAPSGRARRLRVLRLHRHGPRPRELRAPVDADPHRRDAVVRLDPRPAVGRHRRDRTRHPPALGSHLGAALRRRRARDPRHPAAAHRASGAARPQPAARRSSSPTRRAAASRTSTPSSASRATRPGRAPAAQPAAPARPALVGARPRSQSASSAAGNCSRALMPSLR